MFSEHNSHSELFLSQAFLNLTNFSLIRLMKKAAGSWLVLPSGKAKGARHSGQTDGFVVVALWLSLCIQ